MSIIQEVTGGLTGAGPALTASVAKTPQLSPSDRSRTPGWGNTA